MWVYFIYDFSNEIYFASYDGQGPDAYFYAGERGQPSRNGYLIANEKGSTDILEAYNKKDIVLTLPGGKSLKNIRYDYTIRNILKTK